VTADVIRIVDVRGIRAPMLRVWRASVPYVMRGQSEKFLCSGSDKAFRAAIASSLTDDTFITNVNGDFDMQVRANAQSARANTHAPPSECLCTGRAVRDGGYTRRDALSQGCGGGWRALLIGSGATQRARARAASRTTRMTLGVHTQLLSLVLVAGITHKNGDPAACVDSLLAAAFGALGRSLSASEAREQLQALAQMVIPMPDSLSDPVTTKGADGPYALALDEHPRVAKELEARARWARCRSARASG
jgi:hypothetical protein